MNSVSGLFIALQKQVQAVNMVLVVLTTLALVVWLIGAMTGALPWLEIYATIGTLQLDHAGRYAQGALTALFVMLALYLPATRRVMKLEQSHRNFALSMEDITRAYRLSHEADRKKLFKTAREFDSVRERLAYMRDHPDLGALEPEVLTLAAQMSHASRDLARVYSDDKVRRAKDFLRQRQEEIEGFQETLTTTRRTVEELKNWLMQLDAEEGVAAQQIETLERDLVDLLPLLGFDVSELEEMPDPKVVSLQTQKQAERPRPTSDH